MHSVLYIMVSVVTAHSQGQVQHTLNTTICQVSIIINASYSGVCVHTGPSAGMGGGGAGWCGVWCDSPQGAIVSLSLRPDGRGLCSVPHAEGAQGEGGHAGAPHH